MQKKFELFLSTIAKRNHRQAPQQASRPAAIDTRNSKAVTEPIGPEPPSRLILICPHVLPSPSIAGVAKRHDEVPYRMDTARTYTKRVGRQRQQPLVEGPSLGRAVMNQVSSAPPIVPGIRVPVKDADPFRVTILMCAHT